MPIMPPNLKAVQMFIVPTGGDLQYLVKLGHRTVAPHEKPPPNYWADAPQHSSQLIDLSFVTIQLPPWYSLRWCTACRQLPLTLDLGVPSRKGILRTIAAMHNQRNQVVVTSLKRYFLAGKSGGGNLMKINCLSVLGVRDDPGFTIRALKPLCR